MRSVGTYVQNVFYCYYEGTRYLKIVTYQQLGF